MPLSERFYLADAVFVAAVEGDSTLLRELHAALRAPVYPPYLGRRSCPPSHPVELGLHDDGELQQALSNEPWQAARWYRKQYRQTSIPLAVLREARHDEQHADVLRDQPLSFATEHRRHALRNIVRTTVDIPNTQATPRNAPPHDPFAALQEESA
jgi:CRISPR system Cascade subunit CasD